VWRHGGGVKVRIECDREDCGNAAEVPIEPDQTPREVAVAEGWGLVRLDDDEVLRCPEHPLRQGLIPPTPPRRVKTVVEQGRRKRLRPGRA
jgi:hypothetical protein